MIKGIIGEKMFAQIFLGILLLAQGICSLVNHPVFCRKGAFEHLNKVEKKRYFIARGLILCLAALLVIIMAFVERAKLFSTMVFLFIYVGNGVLLALIQIRINKRFQIKFI